MNAPCLSRDVKHLRAPGNYSDNEMVVWCLICFVMGAAGMYVVLGVLSMSTGG